MKKAFLLILFSLVAAAARGQDLTPRIRVMDSDTSFCFTTRQARTLAKLLTQKEFLQKAVKLQEQLTAEQSAQLENKNRVIELQNRELEIKADQLAGHQTVIDGQAGQLAALTLQVNQQAGQLARQKKKTRFFAVATVVITALAAGLML